MAVETVVVEVEQVAPGEGADFGPEHCFGDKCRRAVECIGYTQYHLPEKNGRESAPNALDARAESLAARMARSNLAIRSRLR